MSRSQVCCKSLLVLVFQKTLKPSPDSSYIRRKTRNSILIPRYSSNQVTTGYDVWLRFSHIPNSRTGSAQFVTFCSVFPLVINILGCFPLVFFWLLLERFPLALFDCYLLGRFPVAFFLIVTYWGACPHLFWGTFPWYF